MARKAEAASMPPLDWPVLAVLLGARFLLYLLLGGRYGFHQDEMYFIDCGRHLAFGYVDHPPLVPWLARVATALFGNSLHGLRFFPMLSGAGTIVLAADLYRHRPVYVCRDPRQPLSRVWSEFKRFHY